MTRKPSRSAGPTRRGRKPQGSFEDFELLLQQLGSDPLIELGNPLPEDRFIPARRVGNCPAAHNRALLGEDSR